MSNGYNLSTLIDRQKPGFALEQPFYTDPRLFELDLERIVGRQWLFVDHVSRIPAAGDYLLYEVAGESIIVVRDADGAIHAHYNVCRHRGSRVCLEARGNVRRFVCPYHAWAYDLTGKLVAARQMPEGFDPARYRLAQCHVKVFEGLIYINLSEGEPPEFDRVTEHLGPFLKPHGLTRAKLAHQEVYPTYANWKLVVENFRECYHCASAHPEYTDVNAYVRAYDDGPDAYEPVVERWEERAKAMGHPVGRRRWPDDVPLHPHMAWRKPIREGFQTLTRDGTPAGPLMGDFAEYDGAETFMVFSPLHYIYGANDHATLFRFTPIHATLTEVLVLWMVHEDAVEGTDYDVDHLKWMWDVTTIEDTQIINDNQKGVNSRRYQPGPYSELEPGPTAFTAWYLDRLASPDDGRLAEDESAPLQSGTELSWA